MATSTDHSIHFDNEDAAAENDLDDSNDNSIQQQQQQQQQQQRYANRNFNQIQQRNNNSTSNSTNSPVKPASTASVNPNPVGGDLDCPYCIYKTRISADYIGHVRDHLCGKMFRCVLCNSVYKYRGDCVVHLKRKHQSADMLAHNYVDKFTLETMPVHTIYSLLKPKQTDEIECEQEKLFGCAYCDYKANYKGDVYKHQTRRHPGTAKMINALAGQASLSNGPGQRASQSFEPTSNYISNGAAEYDEDAAADDDCYMDDELEGEGITNGPPHQPDEEVINLDENNEEEEDDDEFAEYNNQAAQFNNEEYDDDVDEMEDDDDLDDEFESYYNEGRVKNFILNIYLKYILFEYLLHDTPLIILETCVIFKHEFNLK